MLFRSMCVRSLGSVLPRNISMAVVSPQARGMIYSAWNEGCCWDKSPNFGIQRRELTLQLKTRGEAEVWLLLVYRRVSRSNVCEPNDLPPLAACTPLTKCWWVWWSLRFFDDGGEESGGR